MTSEKEDVSLGESIRENGLTFGQVPRQSLEKPLSTRLLTLEEIKELENKATRAGNPVEAIRWRTFYNQELKKGFIQSTRKKTFR